MFEHFLFKSRKRHVLFYDRFGRWEIYIFYDNFNKLKERVNVKWSFFCIYKNKDTQIE